MGKSEKKKKAEAPKELSGLAEDALTKARLRHMRNAPAEMRVLPEGA